MSASGRRIQLQEQPLQVLRIVIDHAGKITTRDEIKAKLWPNDTIVEFDNAINTAIRKLRKAFGDSNEQPKYIETVARRGYRFIMAVEELDSKVCIAPLGGALPVRPEAGESLDDQPAGLTGKTVSHYRVLEIIGGGGMGVVYKAEDLRLDRAVALKFLPEEMVSDQRALERFEREARAASTLDHPNICSIYEFGEHQGQPFIVMPLLQGETLRERLTKGDGGKDALPNAQLVELAIQIARGLGAAHEKGIIHRDIKPANIFVTVEGVAKILDFGLAKVLEGTGGTLAVGAGARAMSGLEPPPSSIGLSLSHTGSVIGTAGYMSPEQGRGDELDTRTDLFSFGLVLYEMATGHRAFSGETAVAVRDAILHQPPVPARELNPAMPPKLEAIIDKALVKDRDHRYQSTADIARDLGQIEPAEVRETNDAGTTAKPGRALSLRLVSLGVIVVLACIGGYLLLGSKWRRQPPKEVVVRQLTFNLPANPVTQQGMSPNGKLLVYSDRLNGTSVLDIDGGESRAVLRDYIATGNWLDDDHFHVFKLGTPGMWTYSIASGKLEAAQDETQKEFHLIPTLNPEQLLGTRGNEVWLMNRHGDKVRKILSVDPPWTLGPSFALAPGGGRFVYERVKSIEWRLQERRHPVVELRSCDMDGRCSTILSDSRLKLEGSISDIQWLPDGRILFSRRESPPNENDSNLWTLDVDPRTGRVGGEAKRMTNWTGFSVNYFAGSIRGVTCIRFRSETATQVGDFEADGKLGPSRPLSTEAWPSAVAAWTHDSQSILLTGVRYGKRGVFKQNLSGSQPEALVSGVNDTYDSPVLTPDGQSVLYREEREDGLIRVIRVPLAGGAGSVVLEGAVNFDCALLASGGCVLSELKTDGLAFSSFDPSNGRRNGLTSLPLTQGQSAQYAWRLSPDGGHIAMVVSGPNDDQVQLVDLSTGQARTLHMKGMNYLQPVSWSADANHLYVAGLENWTWWKILQVSLDGDSVELARVPGDAFRMALSSHPGLSAIISPLASPDGRHLAYTQGSFEANVVMLENF